MQQPPSDLRAFLLAIGVHVAVAVVLWLGLVLRLPVDAQTAAGEPEKNQELWQRLQAAASPHRIEWQWVKGHAGHVENERVDKLARAEAERLRA